MPIIKSAKKRVRTAQKATIRNVKTKRTLKSAVKQFQASLSSKKDASNALAEAQGAIDTAVKKGLMHKNKAARQKSQLAEKAKNAGVKLTPAAKKKATPAKKKPTVKKSTAKKTPTKKVTTKKTTAKKAAPAKKPAASKKTTKK